MADSSKGNNSYLIMAAIFATGIAFLLYKNCAGDPKPDPTPVATAKPTATATVELPDFAPPPPPEDDGEDDADVKPTTTGGKRPTGVAGPGPCSKCGQGELSAALQREVGGTAAMARGCYNRALRTGVAEGRISVAVSVGSTGGVCSARVTSDTLNNPSITACVLGKFRRTYSPPKSGCVVVNVPISFSTKR